MATGIETVEAALANPSDFTFDAATSRYGPFTITYTALDSFEASATLTRTVYVTLECPAPETLCAGAPPSCSRGGACVSDAAAAFLGLLDDAAADAFVPPVDTHPPAITLLGEPPEHVRALSATGDILITTSHQLGTPYVDAGASALDFIDGDVSALVSASGLKIVATAALGSEPTPPGAPLFIQYNVVDFAGNAAVTANRRVELVCGTLGALCEDTDNPGAYYCDPLDTCLGIPRAAAFVPIPDAAEITLLGPEVVYVEQGTPYTACAAQAPTDAVCDRGATAVDPVDGDVSAEVDACKLYATFADFGIQACGIDTAVPGQYTVTFRYDDEAAQVPCSRPCVTSCGKNSFYNRDAASQPALPARLACLATVTAAPCPSRDADGVAGRTERQIAWL